MSYAFAARPKWIVLHVLVFLMVSLFAVAGFWQLDRLDERRAHNRQIERALTGPARNLNRLSVEGAPVRARATGHFDVSREMILINRVLNDEQPGNHVLTPLVLGNGRAVLVDRGWVPPELVNPPVKQAAPVATTVTVDGVLLPPEPKRPLSPDDPPTGTLKQVRRVNLTRLEKQLPYRLGDAYLLLQHQHPTNGKLPIPAPLAQPSDGPHLAYAVQWFLFIPTALAVYVVLMRRESKKKKEPASQETAAQ